MTATANGPVPCNAHPETETWLRCQRCATPICPRCVHHTHVGARCRDCADPKAEAGVLASRRVPLAFVAVVLVASFAVFVWPGFGGQSDAGEYYWEDFPADHCFETEPVPELSSTYESHYEGDVVWSRGTYVFATTDDARAYLDGYEEMVRCLAESEAGSGDSGDDWVYRSGDLVDLPPFDVGNRAFAVRSPAFYRLPDSSVEVTYFDTVAFQRGEHVVVFDFSGTDRPFDRDAAEALVAEASEELDTVSEAP